MYTRVEVREKIKNGNENKIRCSMTFTQPGYAYIPSPPPPPHFFGEKKKEEEVERPGG